MDPRTQFEDATGRLQDIGPEQDAKITRWIIGYWDPVRRVRVEGHKDRVRWDRIDSEHRLALLIYPKPKEALGTDQVTKITISERHIVVLQQYSHESRQCHTCDTAKARNKTAGPHECWKYKPVVHWTNVAFYEAWDLEDAEQMLLDLKSAYQATAEQEEEGWGRGPESSFSHEVLEQIYQHRAEKLGYENV